MRVARTRSGYPDGVATAVHYARDVVANYKERLPEIKEEAEALGKEGEEFLEESHKVHALADRYDYSELLLQFAVVLCSLAILSKSRALFGFGLASALVGALIGLSGVLRLYLEH